MKVSTLPTDATSFPKVFRWRIPHLPSGDSVEFTFHAMEPRWSERSYVAALYNSERVIVEKVEGEPAPTKRSDTEKMWLVGAAFVFALGVFLLLAAWRFAVLFPSESFTVVKEGGCDLRVVTTYNRVEPGSDIRVIQYRIFNIGQSCIVKSDQFDPKGPFTIGAGDIITRERLAQSRPKLVETEVYVGVTGTTLKKTLVPLHCEP